MRQRTASSSFVGVFTLKTSEQVMELSGSVTRLVENSVELFAYLESDRNTELAQLMKDLHTIVRLSGEFVDLTLDAEESDRAKNVVARMKKGTDGIEVAIQSYRKHKNAAPSELEKINDVIVACMRHFLEATADLTDMMEDNQYKQGVAKIKQGFQALQLLANSSPEADGEAGWKAKLQYAEQAQECLVQTLENRVNVSQGEALERLKPLAEDIKVMGNKFLTAVKATNAVTAKEVQDPFARLVKSMRDVLDLFQSNLLTQRTRYAFDHERVLDTLNSLEGAITRGSATDATNYARAVVEQMSQLQADTPRSAELGRLTRDVLHTTKLALTDPLQKPQLADSVKALRAHVESVARVGKPKNVNSALRESLLVASQRVSQAMASLSDSLN